MIRVYTASKLQHWLKWKELRAEWPEFKFTARWPDVDIASIPGTPEQCAAHWLDDEKDVRSADVVLVYAEDGEHLRGALIEAGMAIALGKQVIVVGNHPDFGTWQHHPNVTRVADLSHAKDRLLQFSAQQ